MRLHYRWVGCKFARTRVLDILTPTPLRSGIKPTFDRQQLLKAMDSNTTTAVIQLLSTTESFIAFANAEGEGIMVRYEQSTQPTHPNPVTCSSCWALAPARISSPEAGPICKQLVVRC